MQNKRIVNFAAFGDQAYPRYRDQEGLHQPQQAGARCRTA